MREDEQEEDQIFLSRQKRRQRAASLTLINMDEREETTMKEGQIMHVQTAPNNYHCHNIMLDDNLFQIFTYLAMIQNGGDELARCAVVCRQWKNVCDSNLLWREAFKANYPLDFRWDNSKGTSFFFLQLLFFLQFCWFTHSSFLLFIHFTNFINTLIYDVENATWKSKYSRKRKGENLLIESRKSTLKVVALNRSTPRIVSFQAVAPKNPEHVIVKHKGGRMARLERRRDPEEEADIIEDGNLKKFDWNGFEERKRKKEQEEGIPCPQYVYSDTQHDHDNRQRVQRR